MVSPAPSEIYQQSAGNMVSGQVIHEHVYDRLRDALISGQLAPGRPISVRRLAAQFDVSAMPAREAIRRLGAVGALEMTETRRVMIANMTEEKLKQIQRARLALEPQLGEAVLEAIGTQPRQLAKLIKVLVKVDAELDDAIRQGDLPGYARTNSEFHFTLYRASGAHVIISQVERLWLQYGPHMRQIVGRLGTDCLADDQHKEIIAALEAKDAEALVNAIAADIHIGMDTLNVGDDPVIEAKAS
ncbi:MAG: GntR family transcriptional regulator [Sphingomonadales bacterium]